MLYHKIDVSTGMFIEDCIFDSPPMIEKPVAKTRWELVNEVPTEVPYADVDYSINPQYINVEVPQGFMWPKWNGEKWVEGSK